MKRLTTQRNLWIFAGLCFLLSTILFLSDGKAVGIKSAFMGIACIASFINAYITHNKLDKNK